MQTAIDDARWMLKQLLDHPLHAEMNASERLHEVPYSVEVNRRPGQGRIDLLYRGEDFRWKLVEFKTTRIEEKESLVRHLNSEQHQQARRQARRYAEAVEKLLGQRPKALVCLLSLGHQPVVEEV
jgi:ATP-dependent exoDNAse (exonuclease V) beta subunit